MRKYSKIITLNKNSRGIWDLDTTKGCTSGINYDLKGCYGCCYSAYFAKLYGYDFSKTTKRDFKNCLHGVNVINKISKTDIPFIRIGNSCDPSEDWEHTIKICKTMSLARKPIVIITKHWMEIPEYLLSKIEKLNVCINTSISALDSKTHSEHRIKQYNRLKNVCNSVLRIVSCDFNKDNQTGYKLSKVQDNLFENEKTIDNILRIKKNHSLVINKIINIKRVKFLTTNVYASIYNKNTYFGACDNCPEMCGINF